MPRKRKILLVFACCLTVAAAAVIFFSQEEKEPEHAERSLSEWYEQWSAAVDFGPGKNDPKAIEAGHAIKSIGTNALPLLIERITYPDWRPSPLMFWISQVPFLGDSIVNKATKPAKVANDATGIFRVLGSQASPAIPELIRILNTTTNVEVQHRAVFCLGTIGDDSLPVLVDLLQSTNHPARKIVAQWLGMDANFPFTTNLVAVVPALVTACGDNDSGVAIYSIRALGKIRLDPDLSVPALTNAMHSPLRETRVAAVRALWAYGRSRDDAMIALNLALTDPEYAVRNTASNALQRIATNMPASTLK